LAAAAQLEEDGDGSQASPAKHRPAFNEEEFLRIWDEESPPITIPDEVLDDQDDDYDLDPVEEAEQQ
jgi:hypothetical protein